MHADLNLARRLERAEAHASARFVEARARVKPSLGAEWTEIAGAYAMFDGPDSPITQAFGLGLFSEAGEDDLNRIEQFFFERGAGSHLEIAPLAGVALTGKLVERGYRPEEQSTVLFQPLAAARKPTDPTARVRARIVDAGEMDEWIRVTLEGWSDYPGVGDWLADIGPVIAAREDAVSFLAEIDGQAVAAASLCVHEGVAQLAGACTVPAARRQGAQQALLDERLAYSARQGCDIASVVTQPGSASQRNSERQGFRVAYTRTKWAHEAPSQE